MLQVRHIPMVHRVLRPSMLAALATLILFIGLPRACFGQTTKIEVQKTQIEVTNDQKKIIDLTATIAGKIPEVGPYLSAAAKMLFAEEAQPDYVQMKKEWQDYTNTAIENARVRDLMLKAGGFKELLGEIHDIEKTDPQDKKTPLEKWKHLQSQLVTEVEQLRSPKDTAARPTVATYGMLINLHLDTLRRLITLAEAPIQRDTFIHDYNRYLVRYSAELDAEIEKAKHERYACFTQTRHVPEVLGETLNIVTFKFWDGDKLLGECKQTDQDEYVRLRLQSERMSRDAPIDYQRTLEALVSINDCGYAGIVEGAHRRYATAPDGSAVKMVSVSVRRVPGMKVHPWHYNDQGELVEEELKGDYEYIRARSFTGLRVVQPSEAMPDCKVGDLVFFIGGVPAVKK